MTAIRVLWLLLALTALGYAGARAWFAHTPVFDDGSAVPAVALPALPALPALEPLPAAEPDHNVFSANGEPWRSAPATRVVEQGAARPGRARAAAPAGVKGIMRLPELAGALTEDGFVVQGAKLNEHVLTSVAAEGATFTNADGEQVLVAPPRLGRARSVIGDAVRIEPVPVPVPGRAAP